MKKIAVFASGNGSNFQALIDAEQAGNLHASVELLVCDNPNAFVIRRAQAAGIPIYSFVPKSFSSKETFEKEILRELEKREIEFIVLAGYMRMVGKTLLQHFEDKIVNIHPSLLPAFPGKDAVGQALKVGVKIIGVTIHFVDEGMDTGKIVAQEGIPVSPMDTRESLEEKIHEVEHWLYPRTLNQLFHQFTEMK
ncbi:phosphoribosylglycinamide formyltransferase [Bacillus sp. 2205SS5-2]|uniref:phosphoribosylglycinamide formyltransferase n=1 Tax=Bacillus sp. 2205SS5-2 TaxID=3109031 RepID=UPI0030062F68